MDSTSLKDATILEGVVILKYSHLDRPELECFWSATGPVIDSMPQIGTVLEPLLIHCLHRRARRFRLYLLPREKVPRSGG